MPNKPDYNEEMRQWMAKQSFWNRMRHARGGLAARFSKILLLGALLVALGLFTAYALTLRYLAGPDFKALAERECGRALGFENFSALSGKWENGELTFARGRGDGLPENWIRRIEFGAAKIDVPLSRVVKGEWAAPILMLEDAVIDLRSGRLGPEEIALLSRQQEGRAQGRARSGGSEFFGIGIDADALDVRAVRGRGITFRWGGDSPGAGELRGTRFLARRRADAWDFEIDGGVLSFGWLRGVEIDSVKARVQNGRIEIEEGEGRLFGPRNNIGDAELQGIVRFSGEIDASADNPAARLKWVFSETQVSRLMDEPYSSLFAGRLKGEIEMTGGMNDAFGLASRGRLGFDPSLAFASRAADQVEVLQVAAAEMPDLGIPHLVAREGEIIFHFARGRLEVEKIDWRTDDAPRMEGRLTFDLSQNELEGEWRIGFPENALKRRPVVAEKVFGESADDLRWMRIPLKGSPERCTSGAAAALRAILETQ